MDLDALLSSPPSVHLDAQGNPMPFESAEEVMRFIDASVGDGMHTLETGAGLSTALFAVKRCHHTCVVPFPPEVERLRRWAADSGVSLERVTFHEDRSERVLPALSPEPLDLVLIDGAHSFPAPFIDWYYAGRRLRRGGLLVIDDIHLWTGRVLRRFLDEQPGWEPIRSIPMRTAMFRRTGDEGELPEWVGQPFVVRRSYSRGPRGLLRRAVKGADLIRRGDLRGLAQRARGR